MDQLKRLREKKKDMSKMHPLERKAKMDVVEHLQKMAQDAMGDKVKGMRKVTVASDTPHGLQEGLHKAQDLMGEEDDSYAEGGMTESHPMEALADDSEENEHDPIMDMSEAEDDTHPDHENFIHSENEEDSDDGVEEYQDADTDHLLEMDEGKKHARDESEEGDDDSYADGGVVAGMYDHMDEAMINKHLQHLLKMKKGLAR